MVKSFREKIGRPGGGGGRLAYSIAEFAALAGISTDLVYDEIKRGALRARRHGLDKELATLEARQTARAPAAEGERPGDAAREKVIRQALRDDSSEYFRQGLDKELTRILNRRGAA